MTVDEELFVQQILEDRDRLYRETSMLKSQLSGYENFEAERTTYQKLLDEKEQSIVKLKQQVEMLQRKIWGKSSERFINKDPQQRTIDFEGYFGLNPATDSGVLLPVISEHDCQ